METLAPILVGVFLVGIVVLDWRLSVRGKRRDRGFDRRVRRW